MTTEQRLDRIEENIASVTEAQKRTQSHIDQVAEQVDQMSIRFDQMSSRVDQLSSRVDQFVYHTQRLFTKAGTAIERVEGTTESLEFIIRRLDRSYQEMQSQQQEFRVTTNAALEHIGRVMDYLVLNVNPN